jgi:hypothetical protein
MTGIGRVAARRPRVNDGEAGADDPTRVRFTPTIDVAFPFLGDGQVTSIAAQAHMAAATLHDRTA